ncbi:MAG: UbiX family flavin prenyltransferase [Archaeoglobaceae archaeon]
MKIILALTGASGQLYGVKILEQLIEKGIETYLIVSRPAEITLKVETDYDLDYLRSKATKFYDNEDIAAPMASGSFNHDGMVIAPCTMKTASSIAHGITDNLITRAADVSLKEKRKLVLLVRETPLHSGHLRTLLTLSELGAIIMPPLPAFYTRPTNIDDMVFQTVSRVLEKFGLKTDLRRWEGL